jgi:uncharacterized coiled-coil DUF342 family protein
MQTITNGGYSSEEDKKQSDDPRIVQYREGLRAMAEIQQEKDILQKQHDETVTRCKGTQVELDALNLAYQRLLGEIEQYRRERDEAVTKQAETAAIFSAVLELMIKHRPPQPTEEVKQNLSEV